MSDLTSKDAIKILKDAEGKIVLSAADFVPAQITFQLDSKCGANGNFTTAMMERDMNNATPSIFNEAGVPSDTFRRVYKLVESELLPTAYEYYKHTVTYNREMQYYTGTQMVTGGMIGWGTESRHEKKVFQMVTQGARLQSSVDIKAIEVKDRANAMLARYNIMATFALKETTLEIYARHQTRGNVVLSVVGLKFHKIE